MNADVSLPFYDLWKTRAADDDGPGERPLSPGECRDCGEEPCPRCAWLARRQVRIARAIRIDKARRSR